MKNKIACVLVVLLAVLMLCGCASNEELQAAELQSSIESLQMEKAALEQAIESMKTANDYEQYIVEISIKQSHFTLDIGQHIKDSMNEIILPVPASKDFYDSVEEGTVLDDSFRLGSFILKGSWGKWEITVSKKYTV